MTRAALFARLRSRFAALQKMTKAQRKTAAYVKLEREIRALARRYDATFKE